MVLKLIVKILQKFYDKHVEKRRGERERGRKKERESELHCVLYISRLETDEKAMLIRKAQLMDLLMEVSHAQ